MLKFETYARPYAKAIFELAIAEKSLTDWQKMLSLLSVITADKEMRPLIKNPKITPQQLATLFIDICDGALNDQGKNLVNTLAKYERLVLLPAIATLYDEYLINWKKMVEVKVVAAKAIDEQRLEKLKQALQKKLAREVILQCEENAALLGGAILYIGDNVIDGSVRGRLNKLIEQF